MIHDPIVDEVRKAGEKLFKESGSDIHLYFEALREIEKKCGHRIVRTARKFPVTSAGLGKIK